MAERRIRIRPVYRQPFDTSKLAHALIALARQLQQQEAATATEQAAAEEADRG